MAAGQDENILHLINMVHVDQVSLLSFSWMTFNPPLHLTLTYLGLAEKVLILALTQKMPE